MSQPATLQASCPLPHPVVLRIRIPAATVLRWIERDETFDKLADKTARAFALDYPGTFATVRVADLPVNSVHSCRIAFANDADAVAYKLTYCDELTFADGAHQ